MFDAILFGIVEGVTEFLPISSTGHLILTAKLLGRSHTDFLKSFEIAIQLGAILSVIVLYWRVFLLEHAVLKRIVVAFLPTAILGVIFYPFVKGVLLGNTAVVLLALFLGGIFIIVFEKFHQRRRESIEDLHTLTYRHALIIGLCQSIAMIPGVSRSGATILGGLALGLSRKTITEFSFLLAAPTMLAATAFDISRSAATFSTAQLDFFLVGFLTSFLVALASIVFLVRFVQTHTFVVFGVYRIAVAGLFWLFVV